MQRLIRSFALLSRHFARNSARDWTMPRLTEVEETRLLSLGHTLTPSDSPSDCWVVYTDGSLVKRYGIKSSGISYFVHSKIGVVHLESPRRKHWLFGAKKQNSGYTEVRGAAEALYEIAVSEEYAGENILLRTDHRETVQEMEIRIDEKKMNKRRINRAKKKSNPEKIALDAPYTDLLHLVETFPNYVTFQHVYGHNGQVQNDEADKLAYEAACQHPFIRWLPFKPRVTHLRADKKPEFGLKVTVKPKRMRM